MYGYTTTMRCTSNQHSQPDITNASQSDLTRDLSNGT